jgi:cytochrome c-type protein NapB
MKGGYLFVGLAALPCLVTAVLAADAPRLRGPAPFTQDTPAPPIAAEITDDKRKLRNYPDQPPVIPHSIRDYQVDLNVNKCLTCHSRQAVETSQAPMISVTHFMDRNGQFLAAPSPRRYFCTACHVPQTTANPLVENQFVDVDTLIKRPADAGPAGGARR